MLPLDGFSGYKESRRCPNLGALIFALGPPEFFDTDEDLQTYN